MVESSRQDHPSRQTPCCPPRDSVLSQNWPRRKESNATEYVTGDHGSSKRQGSAICSPANAVDSIRGPSLRRDQRSVTEREKTDGSSTVSPTPHLVTSGSTGTPSLIDHEKEKTRNFLIRFAACCRDILLASWINALLVFVPVGIAVQAAGVDKTIVFAMNAIAIIPLASILSYATESVACELGDTIGALLNVTFGNAVELIIFIIALTKNEIRIVQASLLGSILSNILLILGMCFLVGGLRFREQIYNSNVTQMSACLLSLSVVSLLLPTAFHASFNQPTTADQAVLYVSRGTSVILLLVYVLYLFFQLKSHAYMYQSTPQHVIDEESYPGVFADILNSSHSSDELTTSSDSDSDSSSRSNTTARRMRRVWKRGRRLRKVSAGSRDASSPISTLRVHSPSPPRSIRNGDSSSSEKARPSNHVKACPGRAFVPEPTQVTSRDFQPTLLSPRNLPQQIVLVRPHQSSEGTSDQYHHSREVDADTQEILAAVRALEPVEDGLIVGSAKRPFNIRGKTMREALPTMPAIPKVLSNTVFSTSNNSATNSSPKATTGVTPRALHRSLSLPSRLNQAYRQSQRDDLDPNGESAAALPVKGHEISGHKRRLTKTAAIILLIITTALVAVCAEFLVASINHLVDSTSVSEAFIGLIILPIVGNAAEHVTAVTVASKNKVDLAIGVAVGSSIQIALFVTPVIVLLGWILQKDMSLYFSLFETISLFAAAFIVNFLIADGRSNYLEGALLIAAYTIIAVAAFFYPDEDGQSFGGAASGQRLM